jgi:hypothetical protein
MSTTDENARTRAIDRVAEHAIAVSDEKDRKNVVIRAYISRDGQEIYIDVPGSKTPYPIQAKSRQTAVEDFGSLMDAIAAKQQS